MVDADNKIESMVSINQIQKARKRPVKILQFGTGNFIRAFCDYYIQLANDKNNFNGNIIILKSTLSGGLEIFEKQDNLYTVSIRGVEKGEFVSENKIINSVCGTININEDYNNFLELAKIDSLLFIFSNTTERGIIFDSDNSLTENNNDTFPAKLTKLLYQRYKFFNGEKTKGLYILPCELIDNNGDKLKECVKSYISLWNLEEDFEIWNENSVYYCNTLVDRIVSGYSPNSIKSLGYKDELNVVGEPFGLWVIEEKAKIKELLRMEEISDIVFDYPQKYKLIKVRLLNGVHTIMASIALLKGLKTVYQAMTHQEISKIIIQILYEEIIPSMDLDKELLIEYADKLIDRLNNSFLEHKLESIALNSITKFKVRVLPSLKAYFDKYHILPGGIILALSSLINLFLKGSYEDEYLKIDLNKEECKIKTESEFIKFFLSIENEQIETKIDKILKNQQFWGEDLTQYNGLAKTVYQIILEGYDG